MAILGIDFGTTNTVVSLSDRGNFPVVTHSIQTRMGVVHHETFPSAIYLEEPASLAYGLEAERLAQRAGGAAGGRSVRSSASFRVMPRDSPSAGIPDCRFARFW